MPKVTKKKFAEFCGMPTNRLAIYIMRGKVVVVDNEIDIDDQTNRLFLEKNSNKERKPPVKKDKQKSAPPETINFEQDKPTSAPTERTSLSLVQLEREKKLADLQKVEVDTRIAKLREEKLMGQNIPTDLVKSVISQLSKSFVSKFKDGSENILISVSKIKSLNNDEMAQIRGELILIINDSLKSSVIDSKRAITSIVNTYSNSRTVGEHD